MSPVSAYNQIAPSTWLAGLYISPEPHRTRVLRAKVVVPDNWTELKRVPVCSPAVLPKGDRKERRGGGEGREWR